MANQVETIVGGRPLILETGKVANQADGAVTVRYGDTLVLVTVCGAKQPREGVDFLPLTIDYEERLYAAGKIPGSFIRRESRPSEEAILASRLTDRPLRPLFPKGWRNDVQVVITVLSADQENDPDVLAGIGASAALMISDIPFNGPISTVRVGLIDGQLVVNPTLPQLKDSKLDLVVASTREVPIMVEAQAYELPESMVLDGIRLAHETNKGIIAIQEKLQQLCGKKKIAFSSPELHPELKAALSTFAESRLCAILASPSREDREDGIDALKAESKDRFKEAHPEPEISAAFDSLLKANVRKAILDNNKHLTGRKADEIRSLSGEVGVLPRTHGSGLFNRGETQVLTITTLGSAKEEQMLDGIGIDDTKRYMHHYNFPPFSTGEVKRMGSPGRREIGHGALAEKALFPVIPLFTEFPYTIRLVSEVLSSNGSSSMASVCASTLSLMDAGVPIKAPVAGIAMGLITGGGKHVILTDIEGIEDGNGDMDFKVAGTTKGITALQLDVKVPGIPIDVMTEALEQAKTARMKVLDVMNHVISTNRPELSRYAPRMYKMKIDPSKIGTVIGPGGKTIRSIIEQTKVTIDVNDTGEVLIGSTSADTAQKAMRIIESLVEEPEVGKQYTGKVSRILAFGAMVEIAPGKEGLVHVSELADHRVERVEDEVKVGDEVMVKIIEVDRMGRVNLSRRAVFEDSIEPARERAARTAENRGSRGPGGRPPPRGGFGGGRPPMRRPMD